MNNFETRLQGGHPNSLGNTIEIVQEVLADTSLFDELFNCYFSQDEIVRLRVSNAMKRITKENPSIVMPYLDRVLTEIAKINQASTQWTLAQLFLMLKPKMNDNQITQATNLMKNNLAHHTDWIVLNQTMATLAEWSKNDTKLQEWLIPHLERLSQESRRSIANRANNLLHKLKRV